jgi:hypothetical protein
MTLACKNRPPEPPPAITERPAIAANGLKPSDRNAFYHLPQGGNFIPFNVFQALEQPANTKLFREDLDRFGFLPDIKNAANPRALPVGMTIEEAPDLGIPLVGINCTACHVGQIEYKGRPYQIEGAPNLLDFTEFNMEFAKAMEATITHPEKLFRFLRRYFETRESTESIFTRLESYAELIEAGQSYEGDFFSALADEIQEEHESYLGLDEAQAHQKAQEVFDRMRDGTTMEEDPDPIPETLPDSIDDEPLRDGFLANVSEKKREGHVLTHFQSVLRDMRLVMARIHLLRVALTNSNAPMTSPGPGRFDAFGMVRNLSFGQYGTSPMTAPTSISPLWGLADHAWYHFLGMTTTVVGRNIAAIDFIVTKEFETTLLIDNINTLEFMFRELSTPEWPEFFPPLDQERVARGKTIFEGKGENNRYSDTRLGNCASCHDQATAYEYDPTLKVYPRFTPEELGVDPNLMQTFTTPLTEDLTLAQAIGEQIDGIEANFRKEKGLSMEDYLKTYEYGRQHLEWIDSNQHPARLLEGVWATAPYLHNNAVPTLHDLLRPADDRPTTFAIGHREYDPVNVGYTQDPKNVRWVFDTNDVVKAIDGTTYPSMPNGNSNRGHEFGVDLDDNERLDLIEYLKTL